MGIYVLSNHVEAVNIVVLYYLRLISFGGWETPVVGLLVWCIVLYCIVLYCIVLYCIVLYGVYGAVFSVLSRSVVLYFVGDG